MPYNPATKRWVPGGLAVADLNACDDDLRADLQHPVPAGAALGRALAARFSDTLNLLDYVLPTDADCTAGFARAFAAAQALGGPVAIDVPPGVWLVSATVAATLSATQAIHLRGAGSAATTIRQTADADGVRALVGNYGSHFGGGAFCVSGLSIEIANANSTTRTALSIATGGTSGNLGRPVLVDDIVATRSVPPNGATTSWGTGVSVSNIPDTAFLSRITAGDCAVGISVSGSAQTFTTNLFIRDCMLVCATALALGNYLQGIHIDNINTANAATAIQCVPSVGVNAAGNTFATEELNVNNSYLDGRCVFGTTGTGNLNSVKVTNSYLDCDSLGAGATLVSFDTVPVVQVSGCTLHGKAGMTGLSMDHALESIQVWNNVFQGFGAGGVGLSLGPNLAHGVFSGNTFDACGTDIVDAGPDNLFANTMGSDNLFWSFGHPAVPRNQPARIASLLAADDLNVAGTGGVAGAWTSFQAALSADTGAIGAGSATVRYKKFGRTVFFNLYVQITNAGNAAGSLRVSLPFTANAASPFMATTRDLGSPNLLAGFVAASSAVMLVATVSPNGFPVAQNGSGSFTFSGACEAAS